MMNDEQYPPDPSRRRLAAWCETAALGADCLAWGCELCGYADLARLPRSAAVGLRVVARASGGRR